MNFRKISIIAAALLLAGAFGLAIYLKNQHTPPDRFEPPPQIKSVQTIAIKNGDVPSEVSITGKLAAIDKIEVFAEVSGTFRSAGRPFKEGNRFAKGEVLVSIDDTEARLNLLSQKSNLLNAITQVLPDLNLDYPASFPQWETYLNQFDVDKPIQKLPEPQSTQEKYFLASRNLHSQYYNIKSLETRLAKYKIYAPFSGVVTESMIDPGTLVRTGQKLGQFIGTASYELEAAVSLSDLDFIKVGNKVQLFSNDISGEWTGTIRRIGDKIDPSTQTIKVFVTAAGPKLKEGMFLKGNITTNIIPSAVEIPRALLRDDQNVFVVNDSVLALSRVELVKSTETSAIVRGLKDGTTLLGEVFPGAQPGMVVKVVN